MSNNAHIGVGSLGEDIACRYLESRGFTIKVRNYKEKWGEIDIVSHRDGKTHFVEVKSTASVSERVKPEEHLHRSKLNKLFRVFETYSQGRGTSLHDPTFDWQFDAIIVRIESATKTARITYIENIVVS